MVNQTFSCALFGSTGIIAQRYQGWKLFSEGCVHTIEVDMYMEVKKGRIVRVLFPNHSRPHSYDEAYKWN
jgi:hypothetical protein